MTYLVDRHVRHGWVRTIHSAQGATADRVMTNLESLRAATVDARSVYVAISRARTGAAFYTDSRASLGLRDGLQVGAVDEGTANQRAKKATATTMSAATVKKSPDSSFASLANELGFLR